jgi:hypothetical protein
MRIADPGGIDAFFIQLKDLWLERNPSVSTGQISILPQPQEIAHISQKDLSTEGKKAIAFTNRLSRDLQYSGLTSDIDTLEHFIYEELTKKLGYKTASHNRRSPFAESQVRNTNATQKVKRVLQKVPARQIVT